MRILLTICARGGSQGVPGKNIRPLNGVPLIAYTIRQAYAWGKATQVLVSTDSPQIAAVAREYGAEVPFMRPPELATHTAPKIPVLRHALLNAEMLYRTTFEVVVDLDPTAPIRSTADLEQCLEKFQRWRPKTLFSVVEAKKNPYFNMVEEQPGGVVVLSKPGQFSRRQDAPAVYEMNASIYLYERAYLADHSTTSAISDRSMVHVMDALAGADIDREIDFRFLEFLLREGLVTL